MVSACFRTGTFKRCEETTAYEGLRTDKTAARSMPNKHFAALADSILDMEWGTHGERQKVLGKFVGEGATQAQKRRVEMNDIPEDLVLLPRGENLIKVQCQDLHVYYSIELIEIWRAAMTCMPSSGTASTS
ncbi:hypothetical protein NECAME_04988 [Necator americanus]|uniref:Uncharacterized protein n=1 Tax=Necator americanus TaxID=51031 RepID=W2SN83_NECAM|nr:hypothetical protein NECAME_04988 [Necator americanus]ETN70167.1 hypothetical protein NECAME_04988 [Necator americanus]